MTRQELLEQLLKDVVEMRKAQEEYDSQGDKKGYLGRRLWSNIVDTGVAVDRTLLKLKEYIMKLTTGQQLQRWNGVQSRVCWAMKALSNMPPEQVAEVWSKLKFVEEYADAQARPLVRLRQRAKIKEHK